jgi:serine/threonine protein phosphatase 1
LPRWSLGADVGLFRRRSTTELVEAAIPPGGRVYAVGDVHGRFDLVEAALALIEADNAGRRPAQTHLIFLGDLVDRGPQSSAVLAALADRDFDFAEFHAVMGNHEEAFLAILRGDYDELESWLEYGGNETLNSYGVDIGAIWTDTAAFAADIEARIPATHIALLESMVDQIRCGDYLFVHAGIRPGIDFEAQAVSDLRWIREPFLSDRRYHGLVVVHGHTIVDEVEFPGNRIGVDTGAYRSGRLSVLGLEGTERWVIVAEGPGDLQAGDAG